MTQPPNLDRRRLLKMLGLGAVAIALPRGRIVAGAEPSGAAARAPSAQTSGARPGNPIAVSTYSYWRFRADSMLKIEDCLRLAAETGFDGVEILEKQMHRKDGPYLSR